MTRVPGEPAADDVSVVIAVRDRAGWIGRAIDSALAQTRLPGEILVVDDGSVDDTPAVVERYGPPVRLLRRHAEGAYAARNHAIAAARGSLIAFLDSDDAWLPDKLERQLPFFAAPDVGVVFGDGLIRIWEGTKSRLARRHLFGRLRPGAARPRDFVHFSFVPFSSAVVRRECFQQRLFDGASRLAADYRFFFRTSLQWRLVYADGPVFEYSLHDSNWGASYGESLAACASHFREELALTHDAESRALIEQILFNISMRARIARLRRVALPASATAIEDAGFHPLWLLEFVWRQCADRLRVG